MNSFGIFMLSLSLSLIKQAASTAERWLDLLFTRALVDTVYRWPARCVKGGGVRGGDCDSSQPNKGQPLTMTII